MKLHQVLCISSLFLLSGRHRVAALFFPAAPHAFHQRANACGARCYFPVNRRAISTAFAPAANSNSERDVRETPIPAHFTTASTTAWVQQVLDSFEEAFGHGLIDGFDRGESSPEEQARVAARWPCGLVSHDFLRSAEDPIFIYGNEAALQTFGYTWEEFTTLPSRKSCEEDGRGERQELLDDVRESGKGAAPGELPGVAQTVWRVNKTGQRMKISVLVWNVKDAQGCIVGQAARYTVRD
ncbi:unnamed protein product [Scytosiphon promiscuus]